MIPQTAVKSDNTIGESHRGIMRFPFYILKGKSVMQEKTLSKQTDAEGIRINKFLSEAGVCSRREGDRMLEQGRVCIDGVPARPGDRVLPQQTVTVDGKKVSKEEEEIYLAFYKPQGVVCTTAREENGEKIINVIDYVQYPKRVYPVGRLDQSSEGLLLLTNQGDIAEKIQRSRYGHEKEYFVKVNRRITESFLKGMAEGVPILDTVTKPCKVWKVDDYSFRIILTQGLNRQIRRMCQYLGYEVQKLKRIRIMNLTLDGIREGEYREITPQEWEELNHLLASSSSETVRKTGGHNGNSSNHENERAGAQAGRGGKGVLSAGHRNHKQQRVRSDVRRTSGVGERNRNRSGKQSHHQRRV